jgi:hypothetical protein
MDMTTDNSGRGRLVTRMTNLAFALDHRLEYSLEGPAT